MQNHNKLAELHQKQAYLKTIEVYEDKDFKSVSLKFVYIGKFNLTAAKNV